MKVALTSLPWARHNRPSAAISALAPYIREKVSDARVDCYHEHLKVWSIVGNDLYSLIAENAYNVGELLYAGLIFPENAERIVSYAIRNLEKSDNALREAYKIEKLMPAFLFGSEMPSWPGMFRILMRMLDSHLEDFSDRIAGDGYQVVGLTTCFGQLFANLRLAQLLKQKNPGITIVLGGSTVSGPVGSSILAKMPTVDFVIQGEGEVPFAALIKAIESGTDAAAVQGVLTRVQATPGKEAAFSEVQSMDQLPFPDFDSFAAAADDLNVSWVLPVEGSRGCWWDRTRKSGNAKKACYFCNLNVQWSGYREKSVARISSEVATLTARYGITDVFFLDNIVRLKGITALADELCDLNSELSIFYEVRANISPYEMMRLWEAGLSRIQIGIEGLDSSYLRRLGKGTTLLQNLQAMKVACELDIAHVGNLLVRFPGATADEVEHTTDIILRYALNFEPLSICSLWLGVGGAVEKLRDEFGIRNVRNADFYRVGLPDEYYESLSLFDLSFDYGEEPADWTSVYQAVEQWRTFYTNLRLRGRKPLVYFEGNDFVRVKKALLNGKETSVVYRGRVKDLFLFLTEIRTFSDISSAFPDIDEESLTAMLNEFAEHDHVVQEGNRFLNVACASSPARAAARIRRMNSGKKPASSVSLVSS